MPKSEKIEKTDLVHIHRKILRVIHETNIGKIYHVLKVDGRALGYSPKC